MKENILKIAIKAPIEEVFWYTVTPSNTSEWIDEVAEEECSPWLPTVGETQYRNHGGDLVWTTYLLTAFVEHELFELTRTDSAYVVRYTYKTIADGVTELTYHEWMTNDEPLNPFPQKHMDKLKEILEESASSNMPLATHNL